MARLRVESFCYQNRGPMDFCIEGGECVCLTGASGVGKTLLLKALVDLIPYSGCVFLDDVECQSLDAPRWRHQVGMLPAESQWWYETVGEHFSLSDLEPHGLKQLNFEAEVMNRPIRQLSTGERQRLSLLRLLANRPKVLLLDEPTASLDSGNVLQVEAIIQTYRQAHQASVLWVSHDRDQIERVATRSFLLKDGAMIEDYR